MSQLKKYLKNWSENIYNFTNNQARRTGKKVNNIHTVTYYKCIMHFMYISWLGTLDVIQNTWLEKYKI